MSDSLSCEHDEVERTRLRPLGHVITVRKNADWWWLGCRIRPLGHNISRRSSLIYIYILVMQDFAASRKFFVAVVAMVPRNECLSKSQHSNHLLLYQTGVQSIYIR